MGSIFFYGADLCLDLLVGQVAKELKHKYILKTGKSRQSEVSSFMNLIFLIDKLQKYVECHVYIVDLLSQRRLGEPSLPKKPRRARFGNIFICF